MQNAVLFTILHFIEGLFVKLFLTWMNEHEYQRKEIELSIILKEINLSLATK
jgi:hypothetical protein